MPASAATWVMGLKLAAREISMSEGISRLIEDSF
jgi:hypothetical protein